MNFDQFQSGAAKTAAELPVEKPPWPKETPAHSRHQILAALRGAMGMSGEANEVIEHLKKVLFQGHDYDKRIVYGETADVLWYIAVLCEDMGWHLEDMAYYVLAKLRARYPQSHFCQACSRERNEGFETQGLPRPKPETALHTPEDCEGGSLPRRFGEAIVVASPSTPASSVQEVQGFLEDLADDYLGPCKWGQKGDCKC